MIVETLALSPERVYACETQVRDIEAHLQLHCRREIERLLNAAGHEAAKTIDRQGSVPPEELVALSGMKTLRER